MIWDALNPPLSDAQNADSQDYIPKQETGVSPKGVGQNKKQVTYKRLESKLCEFRTIICFVLDTQT